MAATSRGDRKFARNGVVGMSTVSGEAFELLLFRPLLLGAARRGAALLLLAAGEAGPKSCGRADALRFLGGDLPMAILLLVQHDTVEVNAVQNADYQKINRCLPIAINSSSSSQACTVYEIQHWRTLKAAQTQVQYNCKCLAMLT
jgi:hypothetical protein